MNRRPGNRRTGFAIYWGLSIRRPRTLRNDTGNTSWGPCGVSGELLLDTGALVSLLDSAQARHAEFRDFFEAWDGPVVTSEAVLTESTHLLGRVHNGRQACLDFILAGGAVLVPTSVTALQRIRRLIEQYVELPMDYADATLVVLAEDLDTDLILTTDYRDFSVYRIRGKVPFDLEP